MQLLLLFGLSTIAMSQVREAQRWVLVFVVTLIVAAASLSG